MRKQNMDAGHIINTGKALRQFTEVNLVCNTFFLCRDTLLRHGLDLNNRRLYSHSSFHHQWTPVVDPLVYVSI